LGRPAKGQKPQATDDERSTQGRMGPFEVCERRYALRRATESFGRRGRTVDGP
jgi:hypothetical protein